MSWVGIFWQKPGRHRSPGHCREELEKENEESQEKFAPGLKTLPDGA